MRVSSDPPHVTQKRSPTSFHALHRGHCCFAGLCGTAICDPCDACGGGAKAVTIDESEFKLAPNQAAAGAGAVTVTGKNVGTIVHTLEVEGNGVEKKTGNIQPGSSADLKLNLKPGTYQMYCTIPGHKQAGMLGKIVVS